jgi:hypothetical protein
MNNKLGIGDVNPYESGVGRKISETKRRINKKIRENIIQPYLLELRNRGLEGLVYKDFNKKLYSELNHVVAQYRDRLSPKDILNIMIMALDDEYLRSIGKSTSLYSIFFNKYFSLVERYVISKAKPKMYFIRDINGVVQDLEEYGYFIVENNRLVHVPPTKKSAMYYKISVEVENRLSGITNSEFDYLFINNMLKPEELWRIGSLGTNNKFVEVK